MKKGCRSNLPRESTGKIKKSGGRPPGAPNKVGSNVKEAVLQAFNNVGGIEWLEEMAKKEPKAFLQLLSKLIPNAVQQVDADGNSAPLEIKVSYVAPESKSTTMAHKIQLPNLKV